MEMSIDFQLKNDPLISELYKKYKPWKIKSSNFIEIYRNLLWLWYSKQEIHDYFELEDSYNDFIKSFI
jgi:hypothetical protein